MTPSVVSHSFVLPVDRDRAFALLSDPARLDDMTPAWFRLAPLRLPAEPLRDGSEISYRLRWRGVPLDWTSRVDGWRTPSFFAYQQHRGPYRAFRHEHFFEPAEGGTLVRDRVLFRSRGGRIVDRLIAGPDLRRILEYREHRALEEVAEPLAATPSLSTR